MPSSTLSVHRSRLPAYRRQLPVLRDLGLALLSAIGVVLVYQGMSHSVAVQAAAVLALSTAAGMHARLAMGRTRAAAQIVACAALLAIIGAPPRLVGGVLITGLAGAELIARCTRRSAVVRVGLWTGIVAGAASVSGLLTVAPPAAGQALREAIGATAGGFMGAPLMLALGPVAEWLFGHTTTLTMSEWLSYEQPLLRELSATAPGTFQHSVNVGLLADAAASAIGGDAFLARVGGLYHDVGKIRAPQYFVENQHGSNPHDELDPRESARILRAHVSDGVALVDRHRMGPRIADFVREHHGTGTMRLFRDRAASLGLTGRGGETFRYPGPRPRSRETGILMIADQLEATARSAPPADDAACDEIVSRTIERIRAEAELEESQLTERDLADVHAALSGALQAMYHRRPSYPASAPLPQQPAAIRLVARAFGRRRSG